MTSLHRRLLLLGAVALPLGLFSAGVYFGWDNPRGWMPDLAVGWTFVAAGLVAWRRQPESRTGPLLAATGYAWFIGNFSGVAPAPLDAVAAQLQFVHRGLLIHAVLAFPSGRLLAPRDRVTVGLGYVSAVLVPLAANRTAAAALGVIVAAVAARVFRVTIGPGRRARAVALRAAVTLGAALSVRAAADLLFPGAFVDEAVLVVFQVLLCSVAVLLLQGLLHTPEESVKDLVVEVTRSRSATLRETLGRAVGDPSIEVGYRVADRGAYVDGQGRPFLLPPPGGGRAVTSIELEGQPLAVLVHDPAVLDDPNVIASVSVAARLASQNARLQAEIREQIALVEASRRRLVEVGGEERKRLQQRLRDGAGQRLHTIMATLTSAATTAGQTQDPQILQQVQAAADQVRRTLDELTELAEGLHPTALEGGLRRALEDLAGRSPVPVELDLSAAALPDQVEAALYFVFAEALANVTKYADASKVAVRVGVLGDRVELRITDDGIGGADPAAGTGLRGLTDRIEALGGRFRVDSAAGHGTRLVAQIPLE